MITRADLIRRELWKWSAKTWLGRAALRDRSARLALLALGHMVVALSLTVAAPLWLLLLGPILLGVPHAVADVRYLLLDPHRRIERAAAIAVLVPLMAMTALRVGVVLGGPFLPALEGVLGGVTIGAAVVFCTTALPWRLVGLAVALGVAWIGATSPHGLAVVVAHLHNFVAFGLWLFWMRSERRSWWTFAALAGYVLACGLLLGGTFEPFMLATGSAAGAAAGLDMAAMGQTLAPGLEPLWAGRLVLVYAFAQAVHYTVWLRLNPQSPEFYERRGPSTFKRSLRALRRDLGRWGFHLAIGLSVLVPVFALVDAYETRAIYLTLVLFHGWLELAVISHLMVKRRSGAASA